MHPTFTWNGRDLIWIRTDAQGNSSFRMDSAYRYRDPTDHGALRWVLLDTMPAPFDRWFDQLSSQNLRGSTSVLKKKPESDHGSGNYAVVIAKNDSLGTVYEIGWQRIMGFGTGHPEYGRRLYLLHSQLGKWTFLGEGPEEGGGKSGGFMGSYTATIPIVTWSPQHEPSCRINFTVKDTEWELEDQDPGRPIRAMLFTYEDMMLDAYTLHARNTESRKYLRILPGDNFPKIVDKLTEWTSGWESSGEKRREFMRSMWRLGLVQINPGVDFNHLIPDRRIYLLTYSEECNLLRLFSNDRM